MVTDYREQRATPVTNFISESFHRAGAGGIYPEELYRLARTEGIKASYSTVRVWFFCLRKAGLIQLLGTSKPLYPQSKRRQHYRITPGKEGAPGWLKYPLHLVYPETALGSSRYTPKLG